MQDQLLEENQDWALASPILTEWGLGESPALVRAGMRVAQFRNKRFGEIVIMLGMATEAEVERLIASKPSNVRTYEWFRDQGMRSVAPRLDEILCAQDGICYIDERFNELVPHPVLTENDGVFFKRHQAEMNQRGVMPMLCNGVLLLMFANADRAIQFIGLGRKELRDSPLVASLAQIVKAQPETARFSVAVGANSVYNFHLEAVVHGSSESMSDESMQVITESEAADSPVMAKLVRIIGEAIRDGVNDVAISPDYQTGGAIVEFRINQEMYPAGISLTRDEREQIVNTLLARSRANMSASRVTRPVDGNLSFLSSRSGDAFIRLSFIPLEESRMAALSVSMRILPKTTNPIILAKLGITPSIEEQLRYFLRLRDGLFVVAGPTGSGKSTTIGGMLCEHYGLFGDKRKRLSVEQPVERILPGVKHIDVEQHRYPQTDSSGNALAPVDKFGGALRAILRHDPDVIFVGEVRDKASCMVTIDAANTGHLVMTTTHANDTVLAYRRLASFLDIERQFDLVNVMTGILAQRLLPLVCQKCSKVEPVTQEDLAELQRYSANKGANLDGLEFETKRVASKSGCKHCKGGMVGMRGVHGLLIMTPQVRSLLLSPNEADWMEAQRVGSKITLFQSAYSLYEEGLIELGSLLI